MLLTKGTLLGEYFGPKISLQHNSKLKLSYLKEQRVIETFLSNCFFMLREQYLTYEEHYSNCPKYFATDPCMLKPMCLTEAHYHFTFKGTFTRFYYNPFYISR